MPPGRGSGPGGGAGALAHAEARRAGPGHQALAVGRPVEDPSLAPAEGARFPDRVGRERGSGGGGAAGWEGAGHDAPWRAPLTARSPATHGRLRISAHSRPRARVTWDDRAPPSRGGPRHDDDREPSRRHRPASSARGCCRRGCLPTPWRGRSWSPACTAASAGRVLALVAGAGYGKTTLLVQALETSPHARGCGSPATPACARPRCWSPTWPPASPRRSRASPRRCRRAARPRTRSPRSPTSWSRRSRTTSCWRSTTSTRWRTGPVADALALLAADLPPNVHLAMTGRRALGASIARVRGRRA